MAAYKFQIRESYDLTALKRKSKFKYKWLAMCCWIIWCWSIVFLLESNFTIFTVQENSCQHQSKRREIVKRMQVQFTKQDAAKYWGKARPFLHWLCVFASQVGRSSTHARQCSQSNDYKTEDFEKTSLGILIIRSICFLSFNFLQIKLFLI